MEFEHDCAHENGKRFVLMQEAYIDGPADSRGYYVADAFCPDDEADEDGFSRAPHGARGLKHPGVSGLYLLHGARGLKLKN